MLSSSSVGAAGGCRMSGWRNGSGRTLTRTQEAVVLGFSAVFWAAGTPRFSPSPCNHMHTRNISYSPRRCCKVTFSLAGSSTIIIPNTVCNCSCVCAKTFLNCLPPVLPKTFSEMSALRMGLRWYSHARASRTSFFTIWSTPLSLCAPSSPAKPESSMSLLLCAVVRRR